MKPFVTHEPWAVIAPLIPNRWEEGVAMHRAFLHLAVLAHA
jgi:hypothetical protein